MSSDRPKDPRSADSPPNLDIGGGAGAEPNRHPPSGMPRWVKVSLLVVGVLALATVIVLLVGGEHGPGRHGATSPVAEGAVEIAVTGGFRADRPDRYTFSCSEPGHRQAGMEGTLIVLPAGGDLEDHEDLRDFFEDLHG